MVEADVAEANIHQVKVGQPVEILLDALPGVTFSGQSPYGRSHRRPE